MQGWTAGLNALSGWVVLLRVLAILHGALSAVFMGIGAGLPGLAHTWPGVNKWTRGTLITALHGHAAFEGA